MTALFEPVAACRSCGHRELGIGLSLPATPLNNAFVTPADSAEPQPLFPLDLCCCRRCGHVQLKNMVDPLQVFQRGRSASAAVAVVKHSVEAYARGVLADCAPPKGSLAVVIGSNDGTIPAVFAEAGMRVFGVEPAIDLARAAISGGIDTFPGFFSAAIASRIEEQSGRAALVVAGNALVYARDPRNFLEGVQMLLLRGGLFAFEVPYLSDIADYGLADRIGHDVLDYFTLTPLMRLFHAADLEIVSVASGGLACGAQAGGRLRGLAQRLGGPRRRDGSVERLIEQEAGRHSTTAGVLATLNGRLSAVRKAVAETMADWKREGRRIVAYGAPARATTLMHALGLGRASFDFVADDCGWKQGLRTPGLHLPIKPPDALYAHMPAGIVVLSWEFADAIIARHGGLLAAGGRFMVPLPDLRVVSGTAGNHAAKS